MRLCLKGDIFIGSGNSNVDFGNGAPENRRIRINRPSHPYAPATSGAQLAASFRSGWSPSPMQVSFALQPGETCMGVVDADVEQWLEGDGTYTHKSVGWASGLGGLVLGGAATAIGNARRRAKAAREATDRWRHLGIYRIYVTTGRIALQGGHREWHDLWYSDFRIVDYDQKGVILQTSGNPASRLHMTPTDYWFVMVRKLAFNEICDVPMS